MNTTQARVIFTIIAIMTVATFSTNPLLAGDDCCCRRDQCDRCECEDESFFDRLKRKSCCCCCCSNLPEPPRGFVGFSVTALPVSQLAAPVQLQFQGTQNQQDQSKSLDNFSSALSVEQREKMIEKLLEKMLDETTQSELSPTQQGKSDQAESGVSLIEEHDKKLKELESKMDRILTLLEKIEKSK